MLKPVTDMPAESDPRYAEAHQQVFNPLVTLIGQCAYAVTCVLIYLLYKDVAPPSAMRSWTMLTGAVFAIVLALDLAYLVRQPDMDETIRFWRKADKKIPMAFDLVAVGVLLLLYPHGNESLKVLTVAFFVGYVPLQMISDPENAAGNQFSTVAVLGSFAATLLWNGDTTERYLAALMVIYGGVLFFASSILRKVVISAVDGRLQSEKAAKALEDDWRMCRRHATPTRFIAAASHDLGQPLQAAGLFFGQVMGAQSKRQRETAARAFARRSPLPISSCAHAQSSEFARRCGLAAGIKGESRRAPEKAGEAFAPAAKAQGKELRFVNSARQIDTDVNLR